MKGLRDGGGLLNMKREFGEGRGRVSSFIRLGGGGVIISYT